MTTDQTNKLNRILATLHKIVEMGEKLDGLPYKESEDGGYPSIDRQGQDPPLLELYDKGGWNECAFIVASCNLSSTMAKGLIESISVLQEVSEMWTGEMDCPAKGAHDALTALIDSFDERIL